MNRKLNLVLDLDSTVVHTNSVDNRYREIVYNHKDIHPRISQFRVDDVVNFGSNVELWTIFRPYTDVFLLFASKYFNNVILWSAGHKKYVDAINGLLYLNIDKKPNVVYTHENCVFKGSTIHKPLSNLFKDPRLNGVNITNTLVVDDRMDTFSLNPYNGILIPPFEPKSIDDIKKDDVTLLQIIGWLSTKEVMQANDVRYLDKRDIFNISVEEYISRIK